MATTAAAAGFFSGPLHLKKAKSLFSLRLSTSIQAPPGISGLRSISPLSLCILTSKNPARRGGSSRCSVAQNALLEEKKEEEEERELSTAAEGNTETRRKLYVTNFPWDMSAPQIEELFGQCGTVKGVEIIKQKNGSTRGYGFVTMASGEDARAAVEKLDSYELQGRIIRVEFAKRFRKPPPPPPPGFVPRQPVHKIYVSNLAWKARSSNLKELFSEKFNPLSARVVFENPTGRSAGYGFVGFATKEEAESAISELDGKELMGRPIRLRISQRDPVKAESEDEEGN
ncbi:29 kDa ribonucleoprotein, chloroplastic-like [Zingiber officinale]|uniref:29 kDa ribonucleoprotein, chloroplastic-like n=1 Tax=Zingiber officinale TaxID=94328 RepID=UPI001C4ADF71|nr:29 kDa ribonucleoprotein, chloroplastic-like [Zingiber officinale]